MMVNWFTAAPRKRAHSILKPGLADVLYLKLQEGEAYEVQVGVDGLREVVRVVVVHSERLCRVRVVPVVH